MSSRAVPGSAATPCVDQLVLSTKKAEPQDASAAPAESRSARLPEHAIANCLFISSPPEILRRAPVVRRPIARNKRTAAAVRHKTAGIRRGEAGRAEARRGR